MQYLSYDETPVHEIRFPLFEKAGVRLLVKREDLNHPTVSGNKWWKLKYNLAEAIAGGHKTILTFGGAYSNHIYATAAAAAETGLRSIGIIRGEETSSANPTLAFAARAGMELHFVTRETYRHKDDAGFIAGLRRAHGEFFLVPEGGTNAAAVAGCIELGKSVTRLPFDVCFLAVGTGGTMSGLVQGVDPGRTVYGVSVLKNGGFLNDVVGSFIDPGRATAHWEILTEYHGGGYAKTSPALAGIIADAKTNWSLPLDHVYTAKMLSAVLGEVARGRFPRGTTILALHTGGLQGVSAR